MQVLTTTDYSKFRKLKGNRDLIKLHLTRLKDAIQKNYLFTIIIVNEFYEIIDGQHRFECIKELKLPLNYVIHSGYGIREVHIYNKNNEVWNAEGHMQGYSDLGLPDYIKYKNFKEKYQFGHNECLAMLSGVNANGGDITKRFRNGDFKIVKFEKAVSDAEKIWLFKDIYPGFRRRSFIYAMLILLDRKDFDFNEFLHKVKQQPNVLNNCGTVKQYIALIEEIYNYRRRDKINLRY